MTPVPGSGTVVEASLSREQCLAHLAGQAHGRLVLATAAGRPLVRPVNYAYDARTGSVVFRTDQGTKLSALLRNAWACFEIDQFDAVSGHGWSVIVTGKTEPVVHGPEVQRLASLPLAAPASTRAHWFRIRTQAVTGRRIGPG